MGRMGVWCKVRAVKATASNSRCLSRVSSAIALSALLVYTNTCNMSEYSIKLVHGHLTMEA